jgi:hypothetical protein
MLVHRGPFLALDNGSEHQQRQQPGRHDVMPHRSQRRSELMPMDPFGFMNSLMPNMNSMMAGMFQQMVKQL